VSSLGDHNGGNWLICSVTANYAVAKEQRRKPHRSCRP